MKDMFHHGFSDDLPIEEIVQSYLGKDIRNLSLQKSIILLAKEYDSRYHNLQPTYAQWSSHKLSVKFSYLTNQIIELHNINDEDKNIVKEYYWHLVDAMKTLRKAKDSWPDYLTKKLEEDESQGNNSVPEETRTDESKNITPTTKVTLYEYNNGKLFLSSYAYFEKKDLVVDYGNMKEDYEDEYFIKVTDENLLNLYSKMNVESLNSSDLLKKILINFNGEKCFQNFEIFLKENNIQYEYEVRRS